MNIAIALAVTLALAALVAFVERKSINAGRALQRIHDIGAMAWLKFLRLLNALVAVAAPTLLLVHQAYPAVITGAVAKLPPVVGIVAILIFCLLVHYALRRSIKAV